MQPSPKLEKAMHRIAQANIDRFNLLLEAETDPIKRAAILRLLAEEKAKLEEFKSPKAKGA